MNKPKAFLVISEWKNDISWVKELTDDYIIYDKSNTLPIDDKILKVENIGYNLHDIFHFIITHYENLPDVIAFLEGNPFDHCNREKFNRIIYNETFTPVESYENITESWFTPKGEDGGYSEFNNSWYIDAHNKTHNQTCKYSSYNQFMEKIFINYVDPKFIRFSPGGQYIVQKNQILTYSKQFWTFLMEEISIPGMPTEAHIMERALYYIFTNRFRSRF